MCNSGMLVNQRCHISWNFQKWEAFFYFLFFYYNMTISTQYSIKHRIMCRNMWKYPLKYAPETHNSTLKNKKAPRRVRGDTPLGRFAPSQEVFRKFGMLPVASLVNSLWNTTLYHTHLHLNYCNSVTND